MFEPGQYQLIDFGRGRKLERFGQYILDRPCPAAEGISPKRPDRWSQANARFDRSGSSGRGCWVTVTEIPRPWRIRHGRFTFQLKCTASGNTGLFVEQAENWQFIRRVVEASDKSISVLNAFAYTGGSTLAAAIAGANVVHLEASKSVVRWARDNAELSDLTRAPIRWIVEDVHRFVRREVRRGNHYDAIVLDPPSYGHGPKGESWKLTQNLPDFLRDCWKILSDRPRFLVFTCHTAGISRDTLARMLTETGFPSGCGQLTAREMTITSADGRRLNAGCVVRWQSKL